MVEEGTGADGDGDGMITAADYALWRMNFDATGSDPALNPTGWNSLDAQNIDAVDGPDPGTAAGDSALEGWDRSGSPSNTVLSEAFLNGNSTWDPNESRPLGNIFTLGGSQNLVLRFREPNRPGFLRTGLVTYVGGSGSGLGSGAAVPEPHSIILALIPGVSALAVRLPRRAEKSRSFEGARIILVRSCWQHGGILVKMLFKCFSTSIFGSALASDSQSQRNKACGTITSAGHRTDSL
jgi:hypothetical protein